MFNLKLRRYVSPSTHISSLRLNLDLPRHSTVMQAISAAPPHHNNGGCGGTVTMATGPFVMETGPVLVLFVSSRDNSVPHVNLWVSISDISVSAAIMGATVLLANGRVFQSPTWPSEPEVAQRIPSILYGRYNWLKICRCLLFSVHASKTDVSKIENVFYKAV